MPACLTSIVKLSILPYPALKADISLVKEQDISLFYNRGKKIQKNFIFFFLKNKKMCYTDFRFKRKAFIKIKQRKELYHEIQRKIINHRVR